MTSVLRLAISLVVLSCGGGGADSGPTAPPTPVMVLTSLSVSLSATSIRVGETATASAAGADQNGGSIATGTVSWASSTPTVATISASGSIAALAAGQTTIAATAGGKTAQATLSVTQVPVATVVLAPATPASMYVGGTQQLTATLLDASSTVLQGRAVSWSSADPTKAGVSSAGLVTAVAVGTTIISAACEGRSASATITVLPSVSSVSLSSTALTLDAIGATHALVATPLDADGKVVTGVAAQWSTSAASIASVSSGGVVTAVGNGTATITATVLGKSATATATVSQAVARLVLVDGDLTVVANQQIAMPLHVRLTDRLGAAFTGAGSVTVSALSGSIAGASTGVAVAGEVRFDELRFPNAGTTRVRLSAGGGIAPIDTTVSVLEQSIGTLRATYVTYNYIEDGTIVRSTPLVEAVDFTGKPLDVSGMVRAMVVAGPAQIVSGDTVRLVAGSARFAAIRVNAPTNLPVTLGFYSSVLRLGVASEDFWGSYASPGLYLQFAAAADSVVARDAEFALDVSVSAGLYPVGVVRADVTFDSSKLTLVSDAVTVSAGTMTRSPVGPAASAYAFTYLNTTGLKEWTRLLRLRFRAKASGGARVELLPVQLASPMGVTYTTSTWPSSVLVRIP